MRELGVSIYPEKSNLADNKAYLKLASSYGFTRVFTCLLSVNKSKEEIMQSYKELIQFAHDLNMKVTLDISPAIFDYLDLAYDDISFFADLKADVLRLDFGYDGKLEALLSHNKYDIKIELNMSNDLSYVDNVLAYQANKNRIVGAHNFYPQKYTGLPDEFFVKCSQRFKGHGLKTAAFINSQNASFGPWDIDEGHPTLEVHRNLPIETQVKHLWSTDVIDNVIIGNCFASEDELKRLSVLRRDVLALRMIPETDLNLVEKKIIYNELHVRRGDISEYLIRSTEVRKKYTNHPMPPRKNKEFKRGDVVICNENYGKYKGELQICLYDLPVDDNKNIVGHIAKEELVLLDVIEPWTPFKLI